MESHASSSSSWEQPITDTQAVEISDYILSREEEQAYFSDEEEDIASPSWEQAWFEDRASDTWWYTPQFPHRGGPESGDTFWESWLDEVTTAPPPDYFYLANV